MDSLMKTSCSMSYMIDVFNRPKIQGCCKHSHMVWDYKMDNLNHVLFSNKYRRLEKQEVSLDWQSHRAKNMLLSGRLAKYFWMQTRWKRNLHERKTVSNQHRRNSVNALRNTNRRNLLSWSWTWTWKPKKQEGSQ